MTWIDGYSFRARWLPCVLVAAPLALGLALWLPSLRLGQWIGVPFLAAIATALSGFARRKGRELETRLWREWSAPPTTHVLRNGSERIPPESLARYRRFIAQVVPDAPLPTAEEERSMPLQALEGRYKAVTRALINQTRDKQAFRLVYEDNVSYGYWRNLRSLSRVGQAVAVAGFLLATARLAIPPSAAAESTTSAAATIAAPASNAAEPKEPAQDDVVLAVGSMVGAAFLFFLFRYRLTDEMVKRAGFDYAERLVEASEQLATKAAPGTGKAAATGNAADEASA